MREADFTDPSCGLRTGLVDVAVTLAPFDSAALGIHVLRSEPVAVVLRVDDPLAERAVLSTNDLVGRPWFRLPAGTDPVWSRYWTGGRDGPTVRTAHECLQAVRWNGSVGLIPLGHDLPDGLTAVPLADHPPSQLVIAWNEHHPSALVRSFTTIAAAL